MGRLLTIVTMLVVAAAAGYNLFVALSAAPALNPSLRVVQPDGDWRAEDGTSHYDLARYGVLTNRRFLDAAMTGDPDAAFTALDAAENSISIAPADARAWNAMAWSMFAVGQEETARSALRVSQALAPYNLALCVDRLTLARAWSDDLNDLERDGVARDLLTAHRAMKWNRFQDIVASDPLFAEIVAEEELTNRALEDEG